MISKTDFINTIEAQLKLFNSDIKTSTSQLKSTNHNSNFYKIIKSIIDVVLLKFKLSTNKKLNIIYTGEGICHLVDGKYRDRIIENLNLPNIIYINRGRDTYIKEVNGIRMYNIGGSIKLISFFLKLKDERKHLYYKSYKILNDFLLSRVKNANVYSMLYYNHNGLSLVFSKHRKNFKLIEVQHGTIINFPTYSFVSDYKIADEFIVKNTATIAYLKSTLNFKFKDIHYSLFPQKNNELTPKKGIHLLYASSIELNGIHPVFLDFLTQNTMEEDVNVSIRLHPREKNKIEIFKEQFKHSKYEITFDESLNWLESNTIQNLIVISPWSSVIEDAHDNGYACIIIDAKGYERFSHLLNEKTVYVNNTKELKKEIYKLNTL